jgi:ABC-type amino acid transport substrate-binding protein|tara:strand:- start:62 stop:1039 length:978 start_codon:yes stop_codon:yes gene_type:complete
MRGMLAALCLSALLLIASSVSAVGGAQYSVGTSEEVPTSHLLESHEHITESSYQDYPTAMRELMIGNIDFFLTSHLIAADPANSENTPGLSVVGMVEETESYVPVARIDSSEDRGNTELLDAINAALAELVWSNSLSEKYSTWFLGETELDSSDYEDYIGEWPVPTEGTLYEIIDNKRELVVCMYNQQSPLSRQDGSAEFYGFEADIADMVAKRIESHYEVTIAFRPHDSGGEFEAIEDLKRGDTCSYIMASITPQKAISKGLRGGLPYHLDGIVLMASGESPNLQTVQHLFMSEQDNKSREFDQRWIAITLLSLFIAYQLVRRD